jgi:ABC-type transport system involved in cytochrome c biogenesis permease subunit
MAVHELQNTIMLYIHPPLSIVGYVFIFLFAVFLFLPQNKRAKMTKYSGIFAWVFTFAGLVTGMIWAQLAWGNYWSWDHKETLTLLLFLMLSGTEVAFFENHKKIAKFLAIVTCFLVVVTALSSFIIIGLHSFA